MFGVIARNNYLIGILKAIKNELNYGDKKDRGMGFHIKNMVSTIWNDRSAAILRLDKELSDEQRAKVKSQLSEGGLKVYNEIIKA